MAQPYPKQSARRSGDGVQLLVKLALDRDELHQAEKVVEACRQRRALTVARCVSHGICLADIAEVAEISRSLAKQLADRQAKLDLAEPLTEVLR